MANIKDEWCFAVRKQKLFYSLLWLIFSCRLLAQDPLVLTYLGAINHNGSIVLGFDITEKPSTIDIVWEDILSLYKGDQLIECTCKLSDDKNRILVTPIEVGQHYTVKISATHNIKTLGLEGSKTESEGFSEYSFTLPTMVFKKYPSIADANSSNYKSLYKLGLGAQPFVVTEKINGANFSFWTDDESLKVAKRSRWLFDDEDFYSHKAVVEKYSPHVRELYGKMVREGKCAKGDTITVFGELYGGDKLQSRIPYQDHMDFIAFDIFINGEPAPYDEFITLLTGEIEGETEVVKIPVAPEILDLRAPPARGEDSSESVSPQLAACILTGEACASQPLTLTSALRLKPVFQSCIAKAAPGKPVSAEGFVIRSASGRRYILKNKNPEHNQIYDEEKEVMKKLPYFSPTAVTFSDEAKITLKSLKRKVRATFEDQKEAGTFLNAEDSNFKQLTGQMVGTALKGLEVNKKTSEWKKMEVELQALSARFIRTHISEQTKAGATP